jgi:hypothetical protein
MAFYGSASANLSPILFKGNLFSEGVNIIMHSDVSLSMSIASPVSAASSNYTMAPRANTGNFTNFAANYRNSPFYDGIFPTFLQKALIQNKVGDSFRSPNLFSYFDSTPRRISNPDLSTRQSIEENTESYTFLDSVIIARDTATLTPNLGNLKDPKTFYDFWRNRYIDYQFTSGTNSFTSTYPFNVAAFDGRLNDVSNAQSSITLYDSTINAANARLSYYSEDVQGNILSIYYSGIGPAASIKTGGNEIIDGDTSKAVIGGDLYKIPRRKLPTYLITASNEQENAPSDIVLSNYTTKTNVGYSTDKYQYTSQGLYARRYRGCVASVTWNQGCTKSGTSYGSELYRDWFLNYAVPLPFNVLGAINSTGEDAPGINWFNDGRIASSTASVTGDSRFAIDVGGTPQISYYTLSGSNYNYDSNYPTNTLNDDLEYTQAYVPTFLQTLTNYDVNFNPAAVGNSAGLVQQPVTNSNRYGGFWGPFNSLDRIRSDIQNYTMMIIGYFRPPSSGIYRFKIINCGPCSIWIASDKRLSPTGTSSWQEVTSVLSDNDVYSNWNSPTNALLSSPTSSGDRYIASNPDTGSTPYAAWNDVYGASTGLVSDYLEMTAGRYYPIRVILSNPGGTGAENNNFSLPTSTSSTPPSALSCDTNSFTASGNPSFLRLLVSNPKTKPSSTSTALPTIAESEWNLGSISGSPIFFGGLDVWGYGSPFFPLPQTTITKNIKNEINERDLRIISLSSYDSDDIYDGVFFLRKPNDPTQKYRYIKLRGDTYSKSDEVTSPTDSNWRFGRYFTPITYSVSDPNILYQTGSGSNLSVNISKLNDRYLSIVSSGGVGFKTGDRIKISSSNIGGSDALNDLLLSVSNVVSQTYSNQTGTLEGSTRTDFPSFFITKNLDQDNTPDYTVQINTNDAGSGYLVNDRLVITGSILDGQDPQHNINIKVTSIGAGGTITGISPIDGQTTYGSPTNRIGYAVTLGEFNPIGYSSVAFYYQDCTIGYRHQQVTGAAYTTASITGISYTTLPVTGAAYSSFSISGIAYTTGSVVSIGYSTADIVSIAYTSRNIVSIGYSAANIAGIAYTNADIVSIGYSSASVTAIGYTCPQVVSIGYTAFGVNNISYPEAVTITNIVNTTGNANDNVRITLSGVPDLTVNPIVDIGGFVIISGSGDSRIDGRREVSDIFNSTTLEIIPETPITSISLTPLFAKLIVENDNIAGDPVGYGSTALLTTTTNHTFNVGDSIIVRGVKKPQYTNWNSTFVVQGVDSQTSVWLENTGRVGLFTGTTLGQEVGAGLTVGYDQSELQLEIATPVPYQFEVGMGITVFGVTGESAIYNDGYVIRSIIEPLDVSGPYKFDLLQNQTPTQLALPGSNGKIGIHTISGIATVSSTSVFGIPGDSINLKIENSPSSFFNKVFNGAVILDGTRILLGSDSYRNSTTANPQDYASNNVNASTLSGRIGSPLQVTYSNLTPGYTFNVGDKIDVYNTSPTIVYNTVGNSYFYTINSISGSTLTLNKTAGVTTSFALVATSGKIGVRDIPPIITLNTVSGLSTNFGSIGQNITFAIRDSLKTNLNSDLISWSGRIISSDKIIVDSSGAQNPVDKIPPDNYDTVGAGGTIGFIGAKLRVRTSNNHGFVVGNSVRLQNILNQFSSPAYNGTYNVSGIVNSTTFEVDSTLSPSTNYGIVGTSGVVGLIANAVVTTSSTHPFVTGNSVKIQNTNNTDFDNKVYTITNVSSNSFILDSTSTGVYTDDFTTAGSSSGIVGLLNYPATVTYTSPFIFTSGQKVSIANTTKTYGTSNGRYTITYVNDTTFTLDVNANSATDISSKDTSGLIGLMNAKPVVTYDTTHRAVNTDLKLRTGDTVKIQSTGDSKFDNKTFTVSLILNGDPNGTFGISGNNIENSFTDSAQPNFTSYTGSAIGGLVGSKLRIRSVGHNLSNTGSVRIQGTQSSQYDGNSTYVVFDTNNIDLGGATYISDATTDFTKIETTSSSARLGPHGYPAIATFSSPLPSSFTTGSKVKIEGKTVGFNTNAVYTIVKYDSNRVGIAESVIGNQYPASITLVENDVSLYAGLRDSPLKLFVSNTSDFGPTGTVARISISGMNAFFNGTQDARVTSSTTLDLINRTNPDDQSPKIPYNLDGIDTTGVAGLANAFRVVNVPVGHNLGSINNLNIGASIYVRSPNYPNVTNPIGYDGNFTIREILDSNRFTIDQTSSSTATQNPTDYTITETAGYYVGINSGARVTTSSNHILLVNDTVFLSDNQSLFTTQNYTVRQVYSPTVVSLNNTYPTSNVSTFDFKKISTSGSITPQRPLGSTNGSYKVNRILNVTNGNGEYVLPGTTIANDFINATGNNYRANQKFLIKGGLLGGNDSTNDLVVTIGSVSNLGELTYISSDINFNTLPTLSGTADKTLDYTINGVFVPKESQDFNGGGSGATFNIVRSGQRTSTGIPTYTSVSVVSGGTNYLENNVVRILGSNLGGLSPTNDLYVRVLSASSGAINGIAITGIASDSYAVAGFSTIYYDGTNNISRPYGLEKTADFGSSLIPNPPPTQGAYLEQKQDIISLAAENYGGIVKINSVYNLGNPQKSAGITSMFFYGYMWWAFSTTDTEIVFDRSNSGICTIFLDNNDGEDGYAFRGMTTGDEVFIYDSTSTYLDYLSVGYAHTVTKVTSGTGAIRDSITVNTKNYAYSASDNRGFEVTGLSNSPSNLKIIKTTSPLTVVAYNHGFSNGEQVIIGITTDFNGLPYETSTGLGNTTYTVRNVKTNTFELDDSFGRIVSGSLLNGKTVPLITYWYDFSRGTAVGLNGENQQSVGTNTDNGNLSPYAMIVVAKGGRASVVGTGVTPVDNRIGLAKAIGDFITETSIN